MRGLLIGFVGALALYGVCNLVLRGWGRFRLWWGVRRRRRSLRLAKRLVAPTTPPFPWLVVTALTCFIAAMVAIGLSFEPAPAAVLPRLGEEIRIQQPRSAQVQMVATYYHPKYGGRPTANGEIYDPGLLTAAHRTARFGEFWEVAGPSGATVVRINDRGPWCEHGPSCRMPCRRADIDLSEAAAVATGIRGPGKGFVMVRRRL